ncbi:MAG: hypothetical protein GY952_06815 [Rhodobacteraceae bacterium]|nr:hypothetical protein [Paracoccaceae bacterium]
MSSKHTDTHNRWMQRLVFLVFFLVILKFLLPPTAFSSTVLLFDYEFGIIRRGLTGSLLNFFWGDSVSRNEVFVAAAAVSLFGLLAVLAVLVRFLFSNLTHLKLALLLVTSFAFSAIVGSTGYLDLVLIGFTCTAILTDPTRMTGVLARCLAAFVGVFVHEIMLPYFAVFLAADIWLARNSGTLASRLRVAFLPLAAALLGFVTLVTTAQIERDELSQWHAYINAKSELEVGVIGGKNNAEKFPEIYEYVVGEKKLSVDPEAMVVQNRSISDNLRVMQKKRQEFGYMGWVIFDGMPLFLMMLWVIHLNMRVLGGGASWADRLAVTSAILAPQSLNIIAFDIVRFGALSVLVGFLLIVSQLRGNEAASDRLHGFLTMPVFIVVLVLNQFVTVTQLNSGTAHQHTVPWVVLKQFEWMP